MANKPISFSTERAIIYTQYPIPEALLFPSADADRNITPFTKIL